MLCPGDTLLGDMVLYVFKSGNALILDIENKNIYSITNIIYDQTEKYLLYFDRFNKNPLVSADWMTKNQVIPLLISKNLGSLKIISFCPMRIKLDDLMKKYLFQKFSELKNVYEFNDDCINLGYYNGDESFQMLKERDCQEMYRYDKSINVSKSNNMNSYYRKNIIRIYNNNGPKSFWFSRDGEYRIDVIVNFKLILTENDPTSYRSNGIIRSQDQIILKCNDQYEKIHTGEILSEPTLSSYDRRRYDKYCPEAWEVLFKYEPVIEWTVGSSEIRRRRIRIPVHFIDQYSGRRAPTFVGYISSTPAKRDGSVWPVGQA